MPPERPAPAASAGAPDPARRAVSALFAQGYLMFGLKHGIDPAQLCAAVGLQMADLADRDSQIPHAWAAALVEQLTARLPQLSLGIELGQFASLDQLGYLGQALRHCQTPLEGLKLLARSARLLDSAYRGQTLVVESADAVEFRTPVLAPADPPEAIEMGFVNIAKALRELTASAAPREVRFAHDRDQALRRRFEALFGCPVRFASGDCALVFARAVLEQPIAGADAQAGIHFGAHVGRMLERLEEPLVTVAARVIEARLGSAELSQASVAKLLGLSARALQRALRAHQVSYQQLVAQARLARAERLLSNRSLAVYEVAFALGYDDVSAFTRAFRQWTGQSPRDYRASCQRRAAARDG